MGSIDIRDVFDESDSSPDFYCTNAHKWFLCPRGVALMYAKDQVQDLVRPPIISHGFGSGFVSQFIWDGARDYSSCLVLIHAVRLWRWMGSDRVLRRNHHLCGRAADLLASRWRTSVAFGPEMTAAMALVLLPSFCWGERECADSSDAKGVQDRLHFDHTIEVPIKVFHGRLYVRVSVHLHNSLAQFEALADAVSSFNQH